MIPQHASEQPLPLQHAEQTPLPSPETWRLRAGSSILSEPASEIAASGANTDGATGRSEQICSLCRKPMDDKHEHHETTPTEEGLPELSGAGVNGLDAFELGMRQAATAKTKSKLKRPAAASASLKRPAAAGKKPVAGASTGSTPKKSVAGASTGSKPKKPVPGWSIARRLKTYPNGCSKCAHKVPGCTLSCFRARGEA